MQSRAYAKVRRGWDLVYLGFFWPGTVQEDAVALEVDAKLNRYQDAVASVSERCKGPMKGFPVIGKFPRDCTRRPKLAKPTPFTPPQRNMLESMADGLPLQALYKAINTARALVAKGYAEHAPDMPAEQWWIRITDAGREKLAGGVGPWADVSPFCPSGQHALTWGGTPEKPLYYGCECAAE